jgi:flagellar motor switch protein FliN
MKSAPNLPPDSVQAEIQSVQLQEIPAHASTGKRLLSDNIKLIGNVKVKVSAVLGAADISVAELFALKEGSSIKLDVLANAPISVFLDNKLIAKGDLVVVDENFGIQITEILPENDSA